MREKASARGPRGRPRFSAARRKTSIARAASWLTTGRHTPVAFLLADATGDLFGTTHSGGANGFGTVFEIANGTLTTLVSFVNSFDSPALPEAGLIIDADFDDKLVAQLADVRHQRGPPDPPGCAAETDDGRKHQEAA